MLNLQEVDDAIRELENASTNYANCQRLASLYVIKEHFAKLDARNGENLNESDAVQKELSDILPRYRAYVDVKRGYQTGRVPESMVANSIKWVCVEIREFIETLYRNTDMQEERDSIVNMLKALSDGYCK